MAGLILVGMRPKARIAGEFMRIHCETMIVPGSLFDLSSSHIHRELGQIIKPVGQA